MNRERQANSTRVALRHQRQPDGPGSSVHIDVDRVHWRDLGALRRVRYQTLLDQPYARWQTADPFSAGWRQLVPLVRSRTRVSVARANGRILGHCVFRVLPQDARWMLESIGSNTGVYEAEPIWEELLRASIVAAGLEGARRLYARLPSGSGVVAPARKNGFAPYSTEKVLRMPMATPHERHPRVRRQEPSDVWSIHQLYMAIVPRQVQYAEALTSHHWDTRARGVNDERSRGWVLEEGNQVVGYVRAVTSVDRHILELLVHPEHRKDSLPLLETVCASLGTLARRTVYVVVPTYQEELFDVCLQIGFSPWLEQDIHVKYTTVRSQAPIINGLPVTQELQESGQRRVPSYYGGGSQQPAQKAGPTIRILVPGAEA